MASHCEGSDQPSRRMDSFATARVSTSLSAKYFSNCAGSVSGGPCSMISLTRVVKPIERKFLKLRTRDNTTYIASHSKSFRKRLGNFQ